LARFIEVFVPLFVAMSPLTALPIFLTMTEGMELVPTRQLAHRAVVTAFAVAVAIVLLGQALFRFLGITLNDLQVAGGLILLLIAVNDLIHSRESRKREDLGADLTEAGVVPLGTPLIVGPATMTTCVVLADTHGRTLVLVALAVNLLLTGLLLHYSDQLKRFVRPSVSRAFGKVMSLFLGAIAVSMLRTGIVAFVQDAF
jgi:multiple antibiotic resistance protein